MRRLSRVSLAAVAALAFATLAACTGVSERTSTTWGTNAGDSVNVYAVARMGNLLVIGGNFTSVVSPDGRTRRAAAGLAALNASTGNWVWSASPGGTVYRLVSDGNTVWAGGTFGLKRFSAAGKDLGFSQPYAVGTVRGIAVDAGRVYYGGGSAIAATSPSGTGLWTVPVDGPVYTLAMSQGGRRLLAGGYFCSVHGADRPSLASLGLNGAVDYSFDARNLSCGSFDRAWPVMDMVVFGDTAYLAGGGKQNRLAAIDTSTGSLRWAEPQGNGDVQSVTFQDGFIYIGGHFTCVDGTDNEPCHAARQKIAKYTLTGQLVADWHPDLRGGFWGVWSMTGDSKGLYVGGNFTSVNGTAHHKVAIFR